MGFFNVEQIRIDAPKRISCLQCGLYKDCITPKMKATGEGKKRIFILAEAPGKSEDEQGIQLIGMAGKLLRKKLRKFGIDLDQDCRKMNAVNCRPVRNRTPTKNEITACRNRILQEINLFKPKLIILLGGAALESIIGFRWKKNLGGITKWRGWAIPDRNFNTWICPTYHPSFVLREEKNPVCELIFEQDLKKAIEQLDIPFPEFEPIEKWVRIIKDEGETETYLRAILKERPSIAAFDFETTGLKPHADGHRIVCCSIAISTESATSFLLSNNRIKILLKKFLRDKGIKKIGANIKYEHNWAREQLGVEVQGWIHDICIAQHICDNRQGICSLKYIAYVFEGVVDYDSHLSSLLKGRSKSGNVFNQIDKIPIRELLLYNGIDSKLTFSIAMKQMKHLI